MVFRKIFSLLVGFIGSTVSSSNMIIMWGYPLSFIVGNKTIVENWNSCVSTCYNDPRCIFACSTTKISSTECFIFYIGGVASIQLTNGITDKGVVALKVENMESLPVIHGIIIEINQCPSSQSGNFPFTSSTPDGEYSATLTNKTLVTLKYTNYCDDGWTRFERVKTPVCLKVFGNVTYDRDVAESYCAAVGAVLAGVENSDETKWIHAQSLQFAVPPYSYIWLGAQRKPGCFYEPYNASCLPLTNSSFYWTDNSVTGTDGMTPWYYSTGPNNSENNQGCLEMTIDSSSPLTAYAMALDDIFCTHAGRGWLPNIMTGYVCAKPQRAI